MNSLPEQEVEQNAGSTVDLSTCHSAQTDINNEEERRMRRAQKIEEMKRDKERQEKIRKTVRKTAPFALAGMCVLVLSLTVGNLFQNASKGNAMQPENQKSGEAFEAGEIVKKTAGDKKAEENGTGESSADESSADESSADESSADESSADESSIDEDSPKEGNSPAENKPETGIYSAKAAENTASIGGEVVSSNAIVIDLSKDTIVAGRASKERISPASMTKILTVLVAAEHVTNLEDTFTITIDITDYSYVNDCSNTGFEVDETVTIRDLFYGTVLPSGADAALGLATYVAGSQEAFVELMNDKLKELGLSKTAHFTNCVGLYDENHYCTVYDMAMILKAAMDNALCREVLSAHTYTTSPTEQHPEGLTISNWFLRRIEDKDSGGEVIGGKTGYVVQSGSCAASYAKSAGGKDYICVTADSTSSWRCIYDHVALYKEYMDS